MPRKHRDIRSGLKAKGFLEDNQRRHIVLVYEDRMGRTTTWPVRLGLARKDFLRLIDCPMSREEFDFVITERDDRDDLPKPD